MDSIDSLIPLKERISEDAYQDIVDLVCEGLFQNKRGDLLDDISKALTGKTLGDHIKSGIKKVGKATGDKIKDKVLKSNIVKNTIGKKEYENAFRELDRAELDYGFAKQGSKYSNDPAKQRVYKEDAKRHNKEANKKAKRVSEIKRKYGFD